MESADPANATTGSGNTQLQAVSCVAGRNCAAVGSYKDNGGIQQGLLVTETSGTWATGVEAVLPANASGLAFFNAVSCASAGNCTAVGSYGDGTGFEGLLDTETAGMWSPAVEVMLPANASTTSPFVQLDSVSCASAGNCTAVGNYKDSSTNLQGLLLTETSGVWSTGVEASLPNEGTTNEEVDIPSVSCPSAGNCTAVGLYTDTSGHGLATILTESAGIWAQGVVVSTPANAAPDPEAALASVACVSVGDCTAVGGYNDTSGNTQAMMSTETAGTWAPAVEAIEPSNAPSMGQAAFANSVSCASAGNCSAVGSYPDNGGNNQPFVLSQTSGTWGPGTEASLPANASTASQHANLGSVSCSSPGNCTAIGTYLDSAQSYQGVLVAETSGVWGSGMEVQLPANAATGSSQIVFASSVSCSSAGNCAAVGDYYVTLGNTHGWLLSTNPFAPTIAISGPKRATSGTKLAASAVKATLAGSSAATGTITFTVFGPQRNAPTTCTTGGKTAGSATAAGDGSYHPTPAFKPAKPGTYWWYASYGGDGGNNAAASTCGGAQMPKTAVNAPLSASITSSQASITSGKISVKVRCTGGAPRAVCRGKLKLTIKLRGANGHSSAITVASASYRIGSGAHRTIELKLTANGVSALAGVSANHVSARITGTVRGGKTGKRTIKLKL